MAVGLLSCCGPKLETVAPASELYISDLFKKGLAYLRGREDVTEIWILSAAHGLVALDQRLGPYELELSSLTRQGRAAWARGTGKKILAQFPPHTKFVVLAGRTYLAAIPMGAGYKTEDVLRGMQIGQRLNFLKSATQETA